MKTRARNEIINQSCFGLKLLFLLFFITACGGIVPGPTPKVEKTSPENGELNVVLNQSISVTFNKEMAPETLTNTTFSLKPIGGQDVLGDVKLTGQSATFKLKENEELAPLTNFKVTITTGVRDLSGKSLPADHVWNFTSGPLGLSDKSPPKILTTIPKDGDLNVKITLDEIVVIFSEPIDPTTITDQTFTANKGTKGSLSVFGDVVTLSLSRDLKEDAQIEVTIKGAGLDPITKKPRKFCLSPCVKDLAGNPLESDRIVKFNTEKPDNQI